MYARLKNNLELLGFAEIDSYLPTYLEESIKSDIGVLNALTHIKDVEINKRNDRAAEVQVNVSHFPYIKSIYEYDFDFQPGVKRQKFKI